MQERESEIKPKKIYYIGFNYDSSYFSIGTDIGFQIYTTNPLNLIVSRQLNGGIGLIKILEQSNIFCLVGGGKYPRFTPNKLIIWEDNNNEIKEEFRCNSFIINCYIKENCIFAICSDDISIINIKTMKMIKYINTLNNPRGISSVSDEPKKYMLAFPDYFKGNIIVMNFEELEKSNDQQIKKLEKLENKDITIKNAHKGNISVISFNFSGTKLASASDRGTLVRIFDIKENKQIAEFRRGNTEANIYSLNFSYDNSLLGLTSDHGSCHIFSLITYKSNEKNEKNKKNKNDGVMNYITSNFPFSGVGKTITNAFNQEYSWKKFEIPHKVKSCISFGKDNNNNAFIIDKSGNYLLVNLTKNPEPTIIEKTKLI